MRKYVPLDVYIYILLPISQYVYTYLRAIKQITQVAYVYVCVLIGLCFGVGNCYHHM